MDAILVNITGLGIAGALVWQIRRRTGLGALHAYLFSVLWVGSIIASQLVFDGRLRPSLNTLVILFVAWWAFLLGSLLPLLGYSSRWARRSESIKRVPAVSALVVLVALQVLAVFVEYQHYGLAKPQTPLDFFTLGPALRIGREFSTVDLPPYLEIWRWASAMYIPLAVLLRWEGMLSRKGVVVVVAIASTLSVTHFTRAPLLTIVVALMVSWLTLYRPRFGRTAVVSLLIAILAIASFFTVQNALMESDRSTRLTSWESAASYLGGPMRAYDLMVSRDLFVGESGFYTLDALNYVLHKLGYISDYPDLVRPAVLIAPGPLVTNLYTFLDAFTLDFGIAGALLGAFLFGFVGSLAYRSVYSRVSFLRLFLYSYTVYACAMAVANNELIRFSFVADLAIVAVVTLIIRQGPYHDAMSEVSDTAQPTRQTDPLGART